MRALSKDISLSVVPIALIALLTGLFLDVFSTAGVSIASFLLSVALVIFGLTFFLLGVDVGLIPVGNQIGIKVTRKKSLPLILATGFILGFFITMAEPDVQVFSSQVSEMDPNIKKSLLVTAMSLGVGLFVMLALLRTITHTSFRISISLGVLSLFLLAAFVSEFFMTVSFDAGGSTTGPMTVPFIMALGLGLAGSRSDGEASSFGYIGLASIGPVLFVLILGLFFRNSVPGESAGIVMSASGLFLYELEEVGIALIPLCVICIVMQIFFMHLPRIKMARIAVGIFYTYMGLSVLLFAVKWAFMPVAREIGARLAEKSPAMFLSLSLVLGAVVVLAEPAIHVLTEQVEEVSNGEIKAKVMLSFLSVGAAVAIFLSACRVIWHISSWLLIAPGYLMILVLMKWTPPLFIGMAFDSGGVACGPMSSTFLLPFILGSASVLGGNAAAEVSFGVIAMIAMVPIISVEILGIAYNVAVEKEKRIKGKEI